MNFSFHADKPAFVPDTIIVNAVIHTMDPSRPSAEAVAIYRNRIVAIGSSKEIKELVGSATRVIDAKKWLVLPGFNDAHTHFLSGGFQLSSVNLRDANTPQEFAERIRRFAARQQEGRWITGGDCDHRRWTEPERTTKGLIHGFTA